MNCITRSAGYIALLSIVLFGCKAKSTVREEKGHFTVTSPLKTDTVINKEYVAQIQSVRNIEIRAQEKGYLQNIYVDEGQQVRSGQVLFRIMPKIFEAEYQKAAAVVREAELELQNARTLAEKNIVSKNEQALAEAKLDEAKAEMNLARLHVSFTEIRAPFDGTIDRIPFKLGSLIDEGSLLTTLSDNKNVYAYFNVSETEYLDYKTKDHGKDKVSLLLANGAEHKFPGTIETIESVFDNATGNIAFRARFPNPDGLLRHGETGKLRMTVPVTNALIIPQKSTYEMQDRVYVYVVDNHNIVHARNITVVQKLPDLYVVGSGLEATDKLLVEGVQNVKEDQAIEYQFEQPAAVISRLQLIKK